MSKQRATFGKRQREKDKQAKAAQKRDRRASRSQQEAPAAPPPADTDQSDVLAQFAALHQAYEDGILSAEDFDTRRAELQSRIRVD